MGQRRVSSCFRVEISREFNLRSSVVANYVYDLVRRYTLVLVGYSADDPPMRYLMDAISEDASLFGDMKHPYVVADRASVAHDPNGELAAERWKAKSITPLLFEERVGDKFAPLWDSLHAWAEWARGDAAWAVSQLVEKTRTPYRLSTIFESSFVQDVLSLLETVELEGAIRKLRSTGVDFEWIEALEGTFRGS
jgi:hypothetical protein